MSSFLSFIAAEYELSAWTILALILGFAGIILLIVGILIAVWLVATRSPYRSIADARNSGTVTCAAAVTLLYATCYYFDVLADTRGRQDIRRFIAGGTTMVHCLSGFGAIVIAVHYLKQHRETLEIVPHALNEDDGYAYLFGGLVGDYFCGFCADFEAEERSSSQHKKYLVHERRLKTLTEAEYILASPDALKNARKFFEGFETWSKARAEDWQRTIMNRPRWRRMLSFGRRRVHRSYSGKLVLYAPRRERSLHPFHHNYRYFVGTARTGPRCIMYPECEVKEGIPGTVIVISGDDKFAAFLKGEFQRQRIAGLESDGLERYEMGDDGKLVVKAKAHE